MGNNASCCGGGNVLEEKKEPITDGSASNLSNVGKAVYEVLRTKHAKYHKSQWNVTKSKMIGRLKQTPSPSLFTSGGDVTENHSHWFVDNMSEIMGRTKKWCDVMSLPAPDGYFLEGFKKGLKRISDNSINSSEPIIVRLLFGNIIGLPVNCEKLAKRLTEDFPESSNVKIWVGAWRNGITWNHAKFIAVDGIHLHTGGHNVWTDVYLKEEPIHDISVEMEGHVACDAHLFANTQWDFIQKQHGTWLGSIIETIVPDSLPLPAPFRINVFEYPHDRAHENIPHFDYSYAQSYDNPTDSISVISVGRQGTLIRDDRPADDAFIAMFDASQNIIRMSLQDIGPRTVPGTKMALPTVGWPIPYLDSLARAIWLRDVVVEMVLSNKTARRGYANGWSCHDVGSEIIKRIEKKFPKASHAQLRQKVRHNLRICYIRHAKRCKYKSGTGIGNHSKYFIVDDACTYIGSQNLYQCDLAEWGVIIDDERTTNQMIEEYWKPLWEASYFEKDLFVEKVMGGRTIDRERENMKGLSGHAIRASMIANARAQIPASNEFYHVDEEECAPSDVEYFGKKWQLEEIKEDEDNGQKTYNV